MPKRTEYEGYYHASEVKRILGITDPTLYSYVKSGDLTRILPPGRKQGVYPKEEVDALAEKWLAFRAAKEAPKTVFMPARAEDMEEENKLSQRALGTSDRMIPEIRRAWLAKVPEGHYHLKHMNKLVAYFWLLPMKSEALRAFMDGQARGADVSVDDLETFEPGKSVECLIAGIVSEPGVPETTRMHYVQHLLRGVRRALGDLGRKGCIITNIYATSATPTGIAMAFHAGMKEYGPKVGKRMRFVMDVETSDSFLLSEYKKGLAEWKRLRSASA